MPEVIRAFDNLASWNAFIADNLYLCSPTHIRTIVANAMTNGIESAFLGKLGPAQIQVSDENFRETFMAGGLNPRQRAIMELVASEPWFPDSLRARIYAAEALTPFALAMRGRFPRFVGSEYASDDGARRELYPIEFQDLSRLTLLSGMFDCVITNDCLEHVPDIDGCLKELVRVLRPGGVMLSTFPFSFRYESIVKAKLVQGQIEFKMEPEYHGNPAEPEKGSLVFQIPGWQILEGARIVGFARSEMVFISSLEKGITGAEMAGIMIMRCYK